MIGRSSMSTSRNVLAFSDFHRQITHDGFDDVEIYNKELEALGTPTWYNVPWLFCECYLFRSV